MISRFLVGLLFCFIFISSSAQFKNPKNIEFTWKTDTLNSSVDLSEIQIVLPKGSFPSLDLPLFTDKNEGLKMFFPKEPVIAIESNGEAKAYSLNMLTMHEIANDVLNGLPVLITYCPLCNSGVVFNRTILKGGKKITLEFEASGMLRNSDMVMLDRKTETLWQQLMGKAIVGTYNNIELEIIPSVIISVEDFFKRYPKGKILSKKTGFTALEKDYGYNPYKKYDEMENPIASFFNSNKVDKRLPAMERIVAIENNGSSKIFSFTSVAKKGVINDTFNERKVVLFYKPGTVSVLDEGFISKSKDVGAVTVFNAVLEGKHLFFRKKKEVFIDTKTKSEWDITGFCYKGKLKGKQLQIEPHGNHFAFAWLAFHPESEIYK